jgi:hypothetical protein
MHRHAQNNCTVLCSGSENSLWKTKRHRIRYVLDELFFVPVIKLVTCDCPRSGAIKTGQRGANRKISESWILKEVVTGRKRKQAYISEEINRLVILARLRLRLLVFQRALAASR